MILNLIAEARAAGARLGPCCETIGIDTRTVQRWMKQGRDGGEDLRKGPNTPPANKMTPAEVEEIIEVLNSEQFRDLPPGQIVPKLADMGIFVASESTLYRILKSRQMDAHRGRAKPATRKKPKEKTATGPNQVQSWDITYLKTLVRGQHYYFYLFLDIWSRQIVGWEVYDREDNELAAELFLRICGNENIDPEKLTLHSDNGGPMKGATMVATLEKLGVQQTFSRPRVSNDNPYSESVFRTVKGRPNYPDKPFASLEDARRWVEGFVYWYNHEHQHSGISFVTPHQRHEGQMEEILRHREEVYEKAKAKHPERWSRGTREWKRHEEVHLNRRDEPNAAKAGGDMQSG